MTRLSIERPLTMLMGILALVLMGGVAYTYLQVDRLPPVSFPNVSVSVSYPQAAAEDVERLVTQRIEDALAGLPGAVTISSTSSEGRSVVRVQFAEGVNTDLAALDVERRIARIRSRLPADAGEPTVQKADPGEFPVMNIALTGAPLDQLFDVAVIQFQPKLQSIPGVASVNVSGGLNREIQVRVEYARLAAYNLSVQQIANALTAANLTSTVGTVQQGGQLLNLRAVGSFESPAELEKLVVAQTTGGPILLSDVATVREGYKEVRQLQRLNGQEAVGLSVVKASDANEILVADGVRAALRQFETTLPAGTSIQIRNDTSRFTRASLDAIQRDLLLAILLVALVTLLFLHDYRNAIIVLLSVPTSMVSTFLVMYLMGFSLNLMTLMALALMVGILVDASIVVMENIHRHLQLGKAPREAAAEGRNEIGMATVAIAAADIVVYLPIAFMSGFVGQLFRQYGLTVVAATLFSLLVSFTLTPMLASRWLGSDGDRGQPDAWFPLWRWWDAAFEQLRQAVGWVVPAAVRSRWLVVLVSGALVGASAALIQFRVVGLEYAPPEDNDTFNVSLSAPPGTALPVIDRAAQQMESALQAMPEVQSVFATVSVGGGGFGGGGARANLTVQVVPKHERSRSVFDLAAAARRSGTQIPGVRVSASVSSSLPGGGGSGRLDVNVSGPDLETLLEVVEEVKAATATVRGLVDVQDNNEAGTPELRVMLDGVRMAQLNVTTQQATDALRTTLGGRVVSQLRPTGKPQKDITLIAADVDRTDLAKLAAIPVRGATGTGTAANPMVTLGQIATIGYGTGPVQIERVDRNRTISVTGTASGRPLGDVATDLRTALGELSVPPGYVVKPGRQINRFNEMLTALGQALLLAVILEYMLLVALYHSWVHPVVLLVSVPLGLIGSLAGLWITQNTINLFSLIGLIMAFGLVAKTGILLIDFTNTLRQQGMERTQALAEAARIRLRPILMTSATLVFAMLPLAMKFEAGAESRAPMAVVVIGAILTSTVLALLVIPAVYTLFDDLQGLFARRPHPAIGPAPLPLGEAGPRPAGPRARPELAEGTGEGAPRPVPAPFPAGLPGATQPIAHGPRDS